MAAFSGTIYMEPIEVKEFSSKQLSKLRNGHPVRFGRSMSGAGMTIHVSPEKAQKLKKAFQKNKAVTLSLSADEISGSGLFAGSGMFAGGKINVKGLQNVLGVLKKTGTDMGKPFEKTVKVNPFKLGYDLGHDVIAPELKKAPGIREAYGGKLKVPKGLVKFGSKLAEDTVKQAAQQAVKEGIKSAISSESMSGGRIPGGRRRFGKRLGDKHILSVTKEIGRSAREVLRDVVMPEGKKALAAAIKSSINSLKSAEPQQEFIPIAEVAGAGLYAGNTMRGGALISVGDISASLETVHGQKYIPPSQNMAW
jgi:hypothetical protein